MCVASSSEHEGKHLTIWSLSIFLGIVEEVPSSLPFVVVELELCMGSELIFKRRAWGLYGKQLSCCAVDVALVRRSVQMLSAVHCLLLDRGLM